MSFWDLSDGGTAADTSTEYEIPGGNLDPIPNGSSVLAMIDEIKWDERRDSYGNVEARYINARWSVVTPDEYKNRKVFQKLWVTDDDPQAKDPAKKRDKARRMLAAIDANAGGKLVQKAGEPSDDDLMSALANRPMIIKVMVWSLKDSQTGENITGNWIAAVAPKSKGIDVKPEAPKPQTTSGGAVTIDDSDIPF